MAFPNVNVLATKLNELTDSSVKLYDGYYCNEILAGLQWLRETQENENGCKICYSVYDGFFLPYMGILVSTCVLDQTNA